MPREGMREYMLEDRADAAMAAEIVEPVKPLTGRARKPRAPKVYNKHHGDAPADAVYIGRGSPWGNPYVIGQDGDRHQVISLFCEQVMPTLDVALLRGKDLVCFCAPQACHGDHLLTAANARAKRVARVPRPPKPSKIATEWQTGFALHQMKSDPQYRDLVVAPPGYTIVEFDAAGQEYRWMTIASRDETMLRLCQPGEDPHSFMASRMSPDWDYRELIAVNGNKDDPRYPAAYKVRKGGKVATLSLQYRTSAKTYYVRARVDYGMNLTMDEAEHGHFIYHKTYSGVRRYWAEAIAQAKRQGYAETFAGRRVQLNGDWTGPDKWGMGSTALNYPIQGTGADQKTLALSVLSPYVTDIGAYFLFDLHDGLYWAVPDDRVTEFCVTGKRLLDNLPYTEAWGFTPPIPLTWDVKAGKSWGSLRGVN